LKNEQELPNVYVSTEPGAVHFSGERPDREPLQEMPLDSRPDLGPLVVGHHPPLEDWAGDGLLVEPNRLDGVL
jgi:hypothetical protein